MSTATAGPRLGVTLYSFTREFHGRRYTVEELIRRVAADHLGPGLEMVGFQSIRGFPRVSDEYARWFRGLVDRLGLEPSCLDGNADQALRRDRDLTPDEMVEYMEAQIVAARKLGFPVLRAQYSVTPDDMERLLPIAERENVKIGIEIHCHHSPRHPLMQALLERFERLGSPYLGFIPDWGASMTRMPPSILRTFRDRGVPDDVIEAIDRAWNEAQAAGAVLDDAGYWPEFERFSRLAARMGGDSIADNLATSAVALFGHAPVGDWAIAVPWTVHMHGKFYDIDGHGTDPSVPQREILGLFVRAGYDGYISSEWEGWHWNQAADPFAMVAAHHRLEGRILDAAAAGKE